MSFNWKNSGINYLHYLDLCSRIVRASLKPEFKAVAIKRAEQGLKFSKWTGGKQAELKSVATALSNPTTSASK